MTLGNIIDLKLLLIVLFWDNIDIFLWHLKWLQFFFFEHEICNEFRFSKDCSTECKIKSYEDHD